MKDRVDNSLQLKRTDDGSHTLFVPSLNEHYHSVFGAITESMHIFIGAGFNHLIKEKAAIDIFEVGFGTGLNALLTLWSARRGFIRVNYTSIETTPLHHDLYSRLNYPDLLDYPGSFADFQSLHQLPWNVLHKMDDHFSLLKIHGSIHDYQPERANYDLVYFDAFGPDVQPEMWTSGVFEKLFQSMKTGGILVTYSTKGLVKRNLKSAGFTLEKLAGPPGKREMLRTTRL